MRHKLLFTLIPRPPRSKSFPYTTLNRSDDGHDICIADCIGTIQDTPVHTNGCAKMNDIPQIFFDSSKLVGHNNSTIPLKFSILDTDVVDVNITLQSANDSFGIVEVCAIAVETDSWYTCNVDVENSFFPLSPNGEWFVVIRAIDRNTSWWTESKSNLFESGPFVIEIYEEKEMKSSEPSQWVMTSILSILVLSFLIASFLQYLKREKID